MNMHARTSHTATHSGRPNGGSIPMAGTRQTPARDGGRERAAAAHRELDRTRSELSYWRALTANAVASR